MSGLFQFCVMLLDLTNATVLLRLMDKVFKGLKFAEICLLYIDDIIVKSATF